MEEGKYNSELLKCTGLIQETIVLIETYVPGITKNEFCSLVMESNLLSKATNTRIKDIINHAFYRRYIDGNKDTVENLKYLRTKYVSNDAFIQLLLVYTGRANAILSDFIKMVYYDAINKGYQFIDTTDPKKFIEEAIKDGRIEKPWADSTKRKMSEHIIATLIDFKLIDKSKKILPYHISDLTVNYLIHELHFNGLSDDQIILANDWSLFGLKTEDILQTIERLSFQGYYIYQHSGELLKISWKYKSMKESIDAITQ